MDNFIDSKLPIFVSEDNKRIENIMPANNRHFSLSELYKIINCELVQVVELYDETIMIIDEEGKLKEKAVINKLATDLYSVNRLDEEDMKQLLEIYQKIGFVVIESENLDFPHNSIIGNVIICHSKYFQ